MATAEELNQQRSRLIDHFKRAYQIIVGFAIAQACGKVFAHGELDLSDPALLLFLTFFVTIVPIFHGGDRSLDLKYLGKKPRGFGGHLSYIWDVYMLLLTAILFVKISQTIPGPGLGFLDLSGTSASQNPIWGSNPDPLISRHFYDWMAAMLLFDAAVLAVDWTKSVLLSRDANKTLWACFWTWEHLKAYLPWIILNILVGAMCLWLPNVGWSAEKLGFVILGLTLFRTVIDYCFGSDFMFP